MKRKMVDDFQVPIPTNYTDAGKILGLFDIRNVVETLLLTAPFIYISFAWIPVGLTLKIIICAVFAVPIGGFALMGIHDYSLLTFIKIYFEWRRNRRTMLYGGYVKGVNNSE